MSANLSNQPAEPDDIIVSDTGGEYEKAPEGSHHGVCVDVINHGLVEVEYNGEKKFQQKVSLVFQLEIEDGSRKAEGSRYTVQRRFTASLNEKSALRPFLEAWRGKKFSGEELKAFGLKRLVGVNALIQVIHAESNGKVYANIHAIQPWYPRYGEPIQAENYQRPQPRETTPPAAAAPPPKNQAPALWQPSDSDIQF